MKLFLITYPTPVNNEAQIINKLFDEGLVVLHLRKPGNTIQEIEKLLNAIDSKHHSKIALHHYHLIAEKYGINRLHFSGNNRLTVAEQELKNWKKKKYILSTSIHSMNEYELLSDSFSYTFFGPVFESISKPGYKPRPEGIKIIKAENRITKIIAIGGVTADKMEQVKCANFDGAALLGAIWNDTMNAVKTIKKCQEYATM